MLPGNTMSLKNLEPTCTELLPQVLQGETGPAMPVSIEVSSKCAEKFSLSELCVVSVKCTLMPPLVDETAKALIYKDFDSLTYPERFRVVRAITT